MSDPFKIIMDGFTIIVARCNLWRWNWYYADYKIAIRCVYACVWRIHLWNILYLGWFWYAWNIRWYRFRCSSFTISCTYRIFFGYLTFGIFLGYFMSRIFYWLYLLFILKRFYFFFFFLFQFYNILEDILEDSSFVPLLLKIDFVKGPSLIPFYMFHVIIAMPRANFILKFSIYILLKRFLAFRIHLLLVQNEIYPVRKSSNM